MNRESKVLIGVGALAVVGLLVALTASATLGVAVIAIGLVGGVVFLRVTRPDQSDPFADARSVADETNVGNITPTEPLAPWSPDGGLTAWTPPVDLAPPAPVAEPSYEPAVEPTSEWDDASWEQSVTWEPPAPAAPAETNPLDDLVGLDHLDPIAEVERIEERETAAPGAFQPLAFDDIELDIHGNAVNEAVSGADDIMAASQATELHLAAGEQTELQKLLAKVQIRLSAYE
ncbi:MAG TPA: hypothetical protein VIJ47_08505 [Acidimicrobiales bacterium]